MEDVKCKKPFLLMVLATLLMLPLKLPSTFCTKLNAESSSYILLTFTMRRSIVIVSMTKLMKPTLKAIVT